MQRVLLVFAFLLMPGFSLTQDAVNLELHPFDRFQTTAGAALTGVVTPTSAGLLLNGNPVSLDAAGHFSVHIPLVEGVNTLLFRVSHPTLPAQTFKHSLVFDQTAPSLVVDQPALPFYTNQTQVTVFGRVGDNVPEALTLTRDGVPVALNGFQFFDRDLPLREGRNDFSYLLSDAAGNQRERVVSVYHRAAEPEVVLNLPQRIAAFGAYSVAVTPENPDALVQQTLSVAGVEVFRVADGSVFSQTFTHAGDRDFVPVSYRARDRYGNVLERDQSVPVDFPLFVFGQVLDDATGYPLAGVPVVLSSPTTSVTAVSNSDGRFDGYLNGSPLTLSIHHPDYVPLQRRAAVTRGGGLRFHDIRLTARGAAQSLALPVDLPGVALTLSGFSGSVQAGLFGEQALPLLLPLGWSPLKGFALLGAEGRGRVLGSVQLERGPPAGTPLVLLQQEGANWRVVAVSSAAGTRLDIDVPDVGAGSWLVAAPDVGMAVPAVGDRLQRTALHPSSYTDFRSIKTDPEVVSPSQEAATNVSLVASGDFPSGSHAVIFADEIRQTYDGGSDLPAYPLDVQLYRVPGENQAVGTLSFKMRTSADGGRTRSATTAFRPVSGQLPAENFSYNNTFDQDGLHFDFGPQPAGGLPPRAVQLRGNPALTLSLPVGATQLAMFRADFSQPLTGAPQLAYARSAGGSVLLLRHDTDRWVLAAVFVHEDGSWRNEPTQTEMTTSAAYALVHLSEAVSELRGTVRTNGTAQPGTFLSSDFHPWFGRAGDDGRYRFFVHQRDSAQTLRAFDPVSQRLATVDLPVTSGRDLLAPLDVALAMPEFSLLQVEPEQRPLLVPPWQIIRLNFSRALAADQTVWSQAVRLSDGNQDIPLTLRYHAAKYQLQVRSTALLPDRDYQLHIATSLLSADGAKLEQAVTLPFATQTRAMDQTLDLARFYLALENGNITLIAPGGSYPHRSQLIVLNQNTADSWTNTLLSGGFSMVLDGEPGDVFSLALTTPDGKQHRRLLDSVRTGPNQVRLGFSETRLELGDTVLKVRAGRDGFGREVQFAGFALDQAKALREQVAPLAGLAHDPLDAVTINIVDGGGPFTLELAYERPIHQELPPGNLGLLQFTKDVTAPLNPYQPEVTGLFTTAQVVTESTVADQPQGKNKLGKAGFVTVAAYGLFQLTLQAASTQLLLDYAWSSQYVHSLREPADHYQGNRADLNYLIERGLTPFWWGNHRTLGEGRANGFLPINGAAVYDIVRAGNSVSYYYRGTTGFQGHLKVPYSGAGFYGAGLVGTDPFTGEVLNAEGKWIPHYDLLFRWLEPGQTPNQAEMNIAWSVVERLADEEDAEVVVLEDDTEILRRHGYFERPEVPSDPRGPRFERGLRLVVSSDQEIDHFIVNVSGLPSVRVDESNSTAQNAFNMEYDWFGVPPTGRILKIEALIYPSDGATYPMQTFRRTLLIRDAEIQTLNDPENKPTVLSVDPYPDQDDVFPTDPIVVQFTESVRNVATTHVVLTDEAAHEIDLLLLDADLLPIDAADWVSTLYILPTEALRFDAGYKLELKNLRDQNGDGLIHFDAENREQPGFTSEFKTRKTDPIPLNAGGTLRRASAGLQNLTFHLGPVAQGDEGSMKLYVEDTTREPKARLATVNLTAAGVHFPDMEVFAPVALGTPPGSELQGLGHQPGARRYQVVPQGTVVVITYWSSFTKNHQMVLLRYNDGAFQTLYRMGVPGAGALGGISQIGPYLLMGFYDLSPVGPVGYTEVIDMRDFVNRLQVLADGVNGGRGVLPLYRYREEWNKTEKSRYNHPRGAVDVCGFLRTDRTGRDLSFSVSGLAYPGVNKIVPRGNIPIAPVQGYYDPEAVLAAAYPVVSGAGEPAPNAPGRYGGGHLLTGAVQGLRYRRGTDLVTRDLALFHERPPIADGGSLVHVYELPDEIRLDQRAKPTLHLKTLDAVDMAVDRHFGLIALSFNERGRAVTKVWALQTLFDHVSEQLSEEDVELPLEIDLADPENAGLVFWEVDNEVLNDLDPFGEHLAFYHGRLSFSSRDEAEQVLHEVTLVPVNYRSQGWLTYDLASWQASEKDNADRDADDPLRYMPQGVLYATDLPDLGREGFTGFHMETGSWGIELEQGESLQLKMVGPGIDFEYQSGIRHTAGMVAFNTTELTEHLSEGNNAVDLRRGGYLHLKWEYEIYKNLSVQKKDTVDFLVVYRQPATRYLDGHRFAGPIDLLSRTPELHDTDVPVPGIDPRLDLSPSRAYAWEYALGTGLYGVGMLDPQKLYASVPIWWRAGLLPNQPSDIGDDTKPMIQLQLEQPGVFLLQGELNDDLDQVGFYSDPFSSFNHDPENNEWRFNHLGNALYRVVGARTFPDLYGTFKKLNEGLSLGAEQEIKGSSEIVRRMFYPVVREAGDSDTPGSFYTALKEQVRKDKPWENEFWASGERAERHPRLIVDKPNDGGGKRQLERKYKQLPQGMVIETQQENGLEIEYTYDDEGYLTEAAVKAPGDTRTMVYGWEALENEDGDPIELGDFTLKRLTKVEKIRNQDERELLMQLSYLGKRNLYVDRINYGLCDKLITPATDDSTGRPTKISVSGCDTFTSSVSFAEVNGLLLSSGWSPGGDFDFTTTWEQKDLQAVQHPDEAVRNVNFSLLGWFITADSYLDRRIETNEHGLVSSISSHNRTKTLTYMSLPERWMEPSSLVDGDVTWTFSYPDKTTYVGSDSISGDSLTTYFSDSGVPVRTEGPTGLIQGSETTQKYLPIGGQRDSKREKTVLSFDGTSKHTKWTFNRFAEVVGGDRLGTLSLIDRDPMGRVTRAETGKKILTFAYESVENRRQVTNERLATAERWVERFDERGLLREMNGVSPVSNTISMTYDPLGRMVTAVSSDGPTSGTISFAYFEDTDIVIGVTGPGGVSKSLTVVKGPEGILVTEGGVSISGQTDREPSTIRTGLMEQQRELPGIGLATTMFDGFGRAFETSGGGGRQTTHYQERQIDSQNEFSKSNSSLRFMDSYGNQQLLTREDEKSGNSFTIQSTLSAVENSFLYATDQGGQLSNLKLNGEGEIEEIRLGERLVTFREYHASGSPGRIEFGREGTTSVASLTTIFDDHGRPVAGTDPNGQSWSLTYNNSGQVDTFTNPRGVLYHYEYHPELGILNRVSTNEPNRSGLELELFVRGADGAGLLSGRFGNWLGRQQTIKLNIAEGQKGITLTDSANSGRDPERERTWSLRFLEGSGLLTQSLGPDGIASYNHQDFGNQTEVSRPSGETMMREINGFGSLLRQGQNGLIQLEIRRDNRERITGMRTPERDIRVTYNDAADTLSRVDGLEEPIVFSGFNHLGQPESVNIGNGRLVMNLEYHQGGRLSCLTQKTIGGQTMRGTYSTLGDLTSIKVGNQEPIEYSYNRWGGVASLTYKDQEYSVFGSGYPQKLSFPGDISADVDSRGRLIEIKRPGLALKEITYSDDGQQDKILFGGSLVRDYDYVGGYLREIRLLNPSGTEDLYQYQYDDHGRRTSILENGTILAGWTYPDLSSIMAQSSSNRLGEGKRPLAYTDGNGINYDYHYDAYGYLNRVALSGGPTFHYRYDQSGRLLELQSSGMAVSYSGWSEGLPATMRWGDGTTFRIDRESENTLQRIAETSDVFVLDLTWRQSDDGDDLCEVVGNRDRRITRIERKAGTFTEIIEPGYSAEEILTDVTIYRNSQGVTDVIQENYGSVHNQLLGGITRALNNQVLLNELLATEAGADNRRVYQSIGSPGTGAGTGTDHYSYDPVFGNLSQIDRRDGSVRTFIWDGFRRLRQIHDDGNLTASYSYDHQFRRIRAATRHNPLPLAFAYEGSKVIAIGLYEGIGRVQWTHAVGQGPMGPAFIKDLTGGGMDYYIFSDHLGTPLAYKNTHTGTVYLSPLSPWGNSLANAPTRGSPFTNQNFTLPPDSIFPTVPLGISGHLFDIDTGLTYMHNRYYSSDLGHFLNPDFRAPNLYDPRTFTEPYAYASGNPVLFFDPNGLISTGQAIDQELDLLVKEFVEAETTAMKLASGSLVMAQGTLKAAYKLLDIATWGGTERLSKSTDDYLIGRTDGSTFANQAAGHTATIIAGSASTVFTGGLASGVVAKLGVTGIRGNAFAAGAVTATVDTFGMDVTGILGGSKDDFLGWEHYALNASFGGGGGFLVGSILKKYHEVRKAFQPPPPPPPVVEPPGSFSFDSDDLVYGLSSSYRIIRHPRTGEELNFLIYDPIRDYSKRYGGSALMDTPGGQAVERVGKLLNTSTNDLAWTLSKLEMERVLHHPRTLRFVLDGIEEIDKILLGKGSYSHSVTSKELRYIHSNWSRFKNKVKFYENGLEVKPPWIK
ncbi:RHS repeat-associated core domain-containing protein [Acanthopleuribacter pedis]|uniref:SbsA Ig-like domain-containing protein n=1 Tax=Acanthopleuribacter pedis TaxID=442870 RepID=A0A8J7Q6A9_9BACT|nr:RHS repeat-associated core domain-containing protein [Acanthopleuribacter pedis]MBO1319695.1 hypothetical protein [Acanthopleuribacter pedis]